MNWDRIEGNWKQLTGKVRQQWGKLTDDDLDVIDGRREELAGRIQEVYGVSKDEGAAIERFSGSTQRHTTKIVAGAIMHQSDGICRVTETLKVRTAKLLSPFAGMSKQLFPIHSCARLRRARTGLFEAPELHSGGHHRLRGRPEPHSRVADIRGGRLPHSPSSSGPAFHTRPCLHPSGATSSRTKVRRHPASSNLVSSLPSAARMRFGGSSGPQAPHCRVRAGSH